MNFLQRFFFQRVIMSSVTYIIWDFDGTLWHNPDIGNKLQAAYHTYVQTRVKKTLSQEEFTKASELAGSWSAAASKMTRIPEREVIDVVEQSFDKTSYIQPDASIISLLDQLSDYKHVILTNSSTSQTLGGLRNIGFESRRGLIPYPFEKVFTRDNIPALKPDPQSFLSVTGYTKAPKPHHLVVGDSSVCDLEPARKMGFRVMHIRNFRALYE